MIIENISKLDSVNALSSNDMLHILKNSEYSLLSYKEQAKELTDIYQDVSILKKLKDELNSLTAELNRVSSSILTKTEANSKYATKELYESKKEELLTHSMMDSMISKYVTDDIKDSKAYDLFADCKKLAEEMTDFAGAGMVGINQSNAQYQVAPSGE